MSDRLSAAKGGRPLQIMAAVTGLALFAIGVRFIVLPDDAARFFGIGKPPGPHDLHYVVALRDLWLGGLLMGLAWLREWRALALGLALGALVCFADATIAAGSSGRWVSVLFHVSSGVFCAGLAAACHKRASR